MCVLPLGMENGRIPDSAISASFEEPGFEAFNARLNNELYWSGGDGQSHWIQIDLGKVTTLRGVVTQGEGLQEGDPNSECVSKLSIQYAEELSSDMSVEDQLTPLEDQDGNTKIFDANTDVNISSPVTIMFHEPIEARYIRIIPQDICDSNGVPRMRFELLGCPVVDVMVELEQGRGTLTRDENGNYDLKVFPGESITLVCAPEDIFGTFRWKSEPDTILYDSHTGVQISEADPYFNRMSFEPRSPGRWDVVWRLYLDAIMFNETFSFSCSSMFGQSTVNVSATFEAVESVEVDFTGEGDLSSDKQTITLAYDECNTDPTSGKWVGLEDYCYQIGRDAVTQEDAEVKCRERGSELTSIHSESEQNFHRGLMEAAGVRDAWIGFHDRDNDESYVFTDQTPVHYTHWDTFEPDWNGRDLCVRIGGSFFYWIDADCSSNFAYICKRPKGDGMLSGSPAIRCTFYGVNSAGAVRWYKDDEELFDPEYEMVETETEGCMS
ncbi:uncharacterized protein [Amphiura filiformis]|uniref:uncharacterized protein n=1 Tax=Amphiura filiformis TaxID=82378 RepID=UPI003B220C66